MDNNISETVYTTLEARTDEISKTIAERDKLDTKIKSGNYTPQALKEMYPKRDELSRKIVSMCDNAIQEAQNHINQYKADAEELNTLNPAELTDDIKLLQPGIKLTPRDIQGMLKRNASNRTMCQVLLRYAKENDLDTGGLMYTGGTQEQETAKALEGILFYYKKWIDKPNAKEMLTKFFQG